MSTQSVGEPRRKQTRPDFLKDGRPEDTGQPHFMEDLGVPASVVTEGGSNSWEAAGWGLLHGCRSHNSSYDVQMGGACLLSLLLHFPVPLKSVPRGTRIHQKDRFLLGSSHYYRW